jgi:hypothetical protein
MVRFRGPFGQAPILSCVRRYVAYPLSHRQVEELMRERGVSVDHAALDLWLLRYSPLLEAEPRRPLRNIACRSPFKAGCGLEHETHTARCSGHLLPLAEGFASGLIQWIPQRPCRCAAGSVRHPSATCLSDPSGARASGCGRARSSAQRAPRFAAPSAPHVLQSTSQPSWPWRPSGVSTQGRCSQGGR